ncbi:MAG: ATP-binding cassette domain-containing protein [Pseudomonadota bacterium]|jgi:energy-coupling factor transport system ATP-binding protein|nr:ATP-binding cassette domain-containing protein [Pseudomonadota bacterium]HPX19173.1 ATP-binding cassette domain-containing protein [Deltaproteobacteria bacterium]
MKIECCNVSYRYDVPGAGWALSDVDFSLDQGEKVAVIGPAGSGKTTLIQLIDALILPVQGDIRYDGQSVLSLSKAGRLSSIRRRIGVLFQFPEHQFFHETAYDELTFTLQNFFDLNEGEIERRAREVVGRFQLDVDVLRQISPFYLSSGEKRKLALASALLSSPEVLILDEPTAGMDASGRRELIRLIAGLKDVTIILVTHNLEDFLDIVDRCIILSEARLAADIRKDHLIRSLDVFQSAGIVPPLVLRVQDWLAKEGVNLPRTVFDMDQLIGLLRHSR